MNSSPRKCKSIWNTSIRYLTFNEVSVALRPFFFAVHPDRYAQHPEIRTQNEKSLQIFNGYMNDLFPVSPSLRPIKISFSINDKKKNSEFRKIQIQLSGTDPVKIVKHALESCQLNTSDLNLKSSSSENVIDSSQGTSQAGYRTSNVDDDLLRMYLKRKKKSVLNNLYTSLITQREVAVRKSKDASTLRISIKEDIDDLKNCTGLRDIVWQMDWAETHIRRCISNVHRFLDQADPNTRDLILHAFYKNVLRFGRGSFTCCDGSIQLGADQVPEQWEQICLEHQVRKSQIPTLKQSCEQLESTFGGARVLLPYFKGLAQTLTQIQSLTVRIWKKEALLLRLANAGSGTMIEVVTSYDELAVGIDGRLFIPCNVDVPSLVVFLEGNRDDAMEINHRMQALLNELDYSREECIQELRLKNLKWENSFRPDKLLECIARLRNSPDEIRKMVSGLSILISTNPTIHVTNDGSFSIPINWT